MTSTDKIYVQFLNYEVIDDVVYYHIQLEDENEKEIYFITVRYNQLFALHKELDQNIEQKLPDFPPKQWWGNFSPAFIQKRKKALELYFQKLFQKFNLLELRPVIEFFKKHSQQKAEESKEEGEQGDLSEEIEEIEKRLKQLKNIPSRTQSEYNQTMAIDHGLMVPDREIDHDAALKDDQPIEQNKPGKPSSGKHMNGKEEESMTIDISKNEPTEAGRKKSDSTPPKALQPSSKSPSQGMNSSGQLFGKKFTRIIKCKSRSPNDIEEAKVIFERGGGSHMNPVSWKFKIINDDNPIKCNWEFKEVIEDEMSVETNGKSGQVFFVHDGDLDSDYELKIVAYENEVEFNETIKYFLKELVLLKKIADVKSKWVQRVYDSFLVMNDNDASERTLVIKRDACECTLQNIIQYRSEKEKYWEESELLHLMKKLCEVMAEIHSKNISHRDLIPVKILYSMQDSCYKICEWTQGKDITPSELEIQEDQTEETIVHPTKTTHSIKVEPKYLAPELRVLLEKSPDKTRVEYDPLAADVYSMGLTFLQMKLLTEKIENVNPFLHEFEALHEKEEQEGRSIPLSSRLIMRMLEVNPEKRATFTEIFEAITEDDTEDCTENAVVKAILEQKKPEEFEEYMQKLTNIAVILRKLMDLEQSKKKLKKVIRNFRTQTENVRSQKLALSTALNLLGNLYLDMRKFKKAVICYEEAISIKKTLLGNEHPSFVDTLCNLGEAFRGLDEYKKSIACYEESVFILGKVEGAGEENKNVAEIFNKIAGVYRDSGEFENSIFYYEKALNVTRKALGDDHLNIAVILNNLGEASIQLKRIEQAIKYYLEAYELSCEILGDDHSNIAIILSNLGEAFVLQRNIERALLFYERSLRISEVSLGFSHPTVANTLSHMGIAYSNISNFPEAIKYFERSLAILKEWEDERHNPKIANTLNNLGVALRNNKEYAKAISCYEESLKYTRLTYDDDHLNLANTYNNIGIVYSNNEQYQESNKAYEMAIKILKKNNDENHISLVRPLTHIGQNYMQLKAYDKALEYFTMAYRLKKKFYGDSHVHLCTSLCKLAKCSINLEKLKEADNYLDQALKILRSNKTPSDNAKFKQVKELSDQVKQMMKK